MNFRQSNSINAENFILKEKVETLKMLCEQHKSKYEQIEVEWQYKYNQQETKYMKTIDLLQLQISNQKIELSTIKQDLNIAKQQVINSDTKYQKETDVLQKKITKLVDKMNKLRQENIYKDEEIDLLQHHNFIHQHEITNLNKQLKLKTLQYKPYFTSPTTIKMKSVSWNTSTLSNDPELKSSFGFLENISCQSNYKENKIKSYNKRNKWTDTMNITAKLEIDVLMSPLHSSKSGSTSTLHHYDHVITPLVYHHYYYPVNYTPKSQLSSKQYSLQNSHTEISQDVDVSEKLELNH